MTDDRSQPPAGLSHLHRDVSELREKVAQFEQARYETRLQRAEDMSEVRVSIRTVEARLKVLEDGMGQLMTHSTWLLRLLVGGFIAALLQFTIQGGLVNAL